MNEKQSSRPPLKVTGPYILFILGLFQLLEYYINPIWILLGWDPNRPIHGAWDIIVASAASFGMLCTLGYACFLISVPIYLLLGKLWLSCDELATIFYSSNPPLLFVRYSSWWWSLICKNGN